MFFKGFLQTLTIFSFWQEGWTLGYYSMKFQDFLEEIHVTTTRDTLTLLLETKGEYKYYFTVHLVQFTVSSLI